MDEPQPVGPAADGRSLRIIPLAGGTVEGPALRGALLPGAGADWLRVEADGTAEIDVRLTIRAESGALVHVRYAGIRTGPPEVLAKLARGEATDPSGYYFRVAMRFETADPALAWLNRVLAVGVGQRPPEGARYDVYRVL